MVGSNSGTIENCHIKDAVLSYTFYLSTITGNYNSYASGLVGNNSGTVSNCTVDVEIDGNVELYSHAPADQGADHTYKAQANLYIGGIAAQNSYGGIIKNVTSDIKVTGSSTGTGISYSYYMRGSAVYPSPALLVAGAVSDNHGTIEKCSSNAAFTCTAKETAPALGDVETKVAFGGFVHLNAGSISECCASGAFESKNYFWRVSAGGFVYHNTKQIKDCYTNVTIKTSSNESAHQNDAIGGFVGVNEGSVASSYAIGDIDTSARCALGGFVGVSKDGSVIRKSFTMGNLTYRNSTLGVGCFVGVAESGGTLFKNHYNMAIVIKQYDNDVTSEDTTATGSTTAALQGKALLVDELGWSEDIWSFTADGYPSLKLEP